MDMLEYGSKVVAGVTSGKGGQAVHCVPVFDTVYQAVKEHPAEASVISVPPPLVRAGFFNTFYDMMFNSLDANSGRKKFDSTHVFAAKPLGCDHEFKPIS